MAACVGAGVLLAGSVRADEPQLHGALGLAHALGDPQQGEYGFGAAVSVAGEWTLHRVVGVQGEVSFVGLPDGAPPENPAIANHGAGFDLSAMAGLRVHPFGHRRVASVWFDANVGLAFTGSVTRPSFDAHLGYDIRVGRGRLDLGPFVGYAQIFQPDDALRPEDAHVLVAGLHIALGAPRPHRPWRRADRDGDGIFDDADACPDEKGVATDDPCTNGCPVRAPAVPERGDRDHDLVFDDEDACPDVPGVRTGDPRTNGCPRADRDNDLVFDDEDACPDVPGVRTDDARTNGCPAAGDEVRLEGDKLVLGEIIHFDVDSPHIPHPSWPICKKVADFIVANPDVLELDIEGHADETGTDAHNLVLSRDRALAVKRLLVRFGVDPGRITTHAYGESRPRVPGHAEVALRENRRVEFTVTESRVRAKGTVLKPERASAVPGAVAPASFPVSPVASGATVSLGGSP